MKQNDFLDVMKFTLSLFVLAIHAGLTFRIGCVDFIWPWVRLAVPLFFVISSYIFFTRIRGTEDKTGMLKSFVKRAALLYGFWFVLLLPVTLYVRRGSWLGYGVLLDFLYFLRSLFLGSTFIASWFLSALIISILIVFVLSRKCSSRLIVLISVIPFIWAVDTSSYDIKTVSLGIVPYNSFPIAIVWVSLGKWFSDEKDVFHMPAWLIGVCLILSLALLGAEWGWRANTTGKYKCDCYFSLLPACVFAFALIKNVRMNCGFAKHLRSLSVVVFVLHGSVLAFVPVRIFGSFQILRFIIVLVVCFSAYLAIYNLQGRKYFKWLKYSY